MKLQSRLLVPALLACGLGAAHTLFSSPCQSGYCLSIPVYAAPQGAARGPITPARDPELEQQSLKSLEAARFYFTKRQPKKDEPNAAGRLKAVEDRLREIADTYPQFSKIDQVYYLLGEVYSRTGDREEAEKFYSLVVNEFKDSENFRDAKKRLDELHAQTDKKAEHKDSKKEGKKEN